MPEFKYKAIKGFHNSAGTRFEPGDAVYPDDLTEADAAELLAENAIEAVHETSEGE